MTRRIKRPRNCWGQLAEALRNVHGDMQDYPLPGKIHTLKDGRSINFIFRIEDCLITAAQDAEELESRMDDER